MYSDVGCYLLTCLSYFFLFFFLGRFCYIYPWIYISSCCKAEHLSCYIYRMWISPFRKTVQDEEGLA